MEESISHARGAGRKQRQRKVLLLLALITALGAVIAASVFFVDTVVDQVVPTISPQLANTQPTEASTAPATEPAPETEPPTAPPTEPPGILPPEVTALQALLDSMTLEEKVCQLFMVTPEALTGEYAVTEAKDDFVAELSQFPVGGVILFAQNLKNPGQCKALTEAFQSASRIPLLIGVDEEGGIVSRLGSKENMGVTHFPNMGKIGKSGDTAKAYEVGFTLSGELLVLGFNLDLAPVADVSSNPENPVIGDRAFGSDPVLVSQMVAACVQGFQDGGLSCCLKHFPGHGDTKDDSHTGLAVISKSLEELRQTELPTFAAGIQAGAPVIMTAHISLPAILGDNTPATLSHEIVTGLLRNELGFEGVVITDAMNMGAITDTYSADEAAVLAVKAGCDMLLMPNDLGKAYNGVLEAVRSGKISMERLNESIERILKLKLEYGICPAD